MHSRFVGTPIAYLEYREPAEVVVRRRAAYIMHTMYMRALCDGCVRRVIDLVDSIDAGAASGTVSVESVVVSATAAAARPARSSAWHTVAGLDLEW